jgi:hypothetical protein
MAQTASARRQFLVSVSGISGLWSANTGGKKGATPTKEFDGGTTVPYVLYSNPVVDDLTLTRPFVVGRDDVLLTQLLPKVPGLPLTASQQPTDPNFVPGGTARTWVGQLTSAEGPQADANTDGGAMITLVLTCTSAA